MESSTETDEQREPTAEEDTREPYEPPALTKKRELTKVTLFSVPV